LSAPKAARRCSLVYTCRVHASADGRWLLAVTTQGPAWVRADDIAIGSAATVSGYAAQAPGRVVRGTRRA
jgi:hypothetical protein